LPQDLLQLVQEKMLEDTARVPRYRRLIMTLGQVLDGDFFTQYIKIGISDPVTQGSKGYRLTFICLRKRHDAFRGEN
jgi:ribonucleases P/MRP protein subunit RPP40